MEKGQKKIISVNENIGTPRTPLDVSSLCLLIVALILSVVGLLFAINAYDGKPDADYSGCIPPVVSMLSNLYGILLIVIPWLGGSVPPFGNGCFGTPVKVFFFFDLALNAVFTLTFVPLILCQLGFLNSPDYGNCSKWCVVIECKLWDYLLGYFTVQFLAKIFVLKRYPAKPWAKVLSSLA